MADKNHVELDWAVDAITVGARHRKDLGDLQPLADSIDQYGLLQPLTISEEGTLICGARRLAAIKQLGWRQVNVWVRVGLSDRLSAMMAERDDNICHKQFTKLELADLYEEMKNEIAADAARRQRATQFGATPEGDGAAKLAAPWEGRYDSRRQAADIVGGASHMTLEKIAAIRQIAADTTRSDTIRAQATDALAHIEANQPVDPLFLQLRSVVRLDDLEKVAADESQPPAVREEAASGAILLRKLEAAQMRDADLDKAARAALDRVQAARQTKTLPAIPKTVAPLAPVIKPLKWFTWTWNELKDWPTHCDPHMVAAGLTEPEWQQFRQTIADSVAFMEQVADLRQAA